MRQPIRRRPRRFRPGAEPCEARALLNAAPIGLGGADRPPPELLRLGPSYTLGRPNTPVAPYGATADAASFIDPSARIAREQHALIGRNSFLAPYATIDASVGFVKIGSVSAVLDNATLIATPGPGAPASSVFVGDLVEIGFGARVTGPSLIGAYGPGALPTGIGPNALIEGATIAPGAIVGALARVGPGVVVPSGVFVLPGANVTTQAEAIDPALGKVAPATPAQLQELGRRLAHTAILARGYINLYQGNPATGTAPGTRAEGVFNGNLAALRGASPEPNTVLAPGRIAPQFLSPRRGLVRAKLPDFPARVTGWAQFGATAEQVAHSLGRSNSIRADDGQPIAFGSAPVTGTGVTFNAPLGSVGNVPGAPATGGTGTGGAGAAPGLVTIPGTIPGPGNEPPAEPGRPGLPTGSGLFPGVGFKGASPGFPDLTAGGGAGAGEGAGGTGTAAPAVNVGRAGELIIGRRLRADDRAVILGGPSAISRVGDDVTVGAGAVVSRSTLGDGVVIGPRAYVADSILQPGTVVPPGAILINGRLLGVVGW